MESECGYDLWHHHYFTDLCTIVPSKEICQVEVQNSYHIDAVSWIFNKLVFFLRWFVKISVAFRNLDINGIKLTILNFIDHSEGWEVTN